LEPFAAFAFAWLDVMAGSVKARTLTEYRRLYDTYVAPEFASRPIGAVSPADARRFRASLVDGGLARGTIKHAFDVFRRVLDVAVQDGAIPANPAASARPDPSPSAGGDLKGKGSCVIYWRGRKSALTRRSVWGGWGSNPRPDGL
jgi:integrase